jgi:hypothetical protein
MSTAVPSTVSAEDLPERTSHLTYSFSIPIAPTSYGIVKLTAEDEKLPD